MRLSTELIYLTHYVFQVLNLKMVHAEHLCLFIELLFPLLWYFIPVCLLDQQLLSVWISFTNLDVLCFLSIHFLGFFDHSFNFSGILPNSFSLDAISVGFIKFLEELCFVMFFVYAFSVTPLEFIQLVLIALLDLYCYWLYALSWHICSVDVGLGCGYIHCVAEKWSPRIPLTLTSSRWFCVQER